jgi:hypothetical protein
MDNETGSVEGHAHSDEVADFDHQFASVASVLVFKISGSLKNS